MFGLKTCSIQIPVCLVSLLKVSCSCPKTSLGKYFSDFPTFRGPQDLPGPLPGTFATPSVHRPDAAILPHLPLPARLGSPAYPSPSLPDKALPVPPGSSRQPNPAWGLLQAKGWPQQQRSLLGGDFHQGLVWKLAVVTHLRKFCWLLGEIKCTLKFQQILNSVLCVSRSHVPFPMWCLRRVRSRFQRLIESGSGSLLQRDATCFLNMKHLVKAVLREMRLYTYLWHFIYSCFYSALNCCSSCIT